MATLPLIHIMCKTLFQALNSVQSLHFRSGNIRNSKAHCVEMHIEYDMTSTTGISTSYEYIIYVLISIRTAGTRFI